MFLIRIHILCGERSIHTLYMNKVEILLSKKYKIRSGVLHSKLSDNSFYIKINITDTLIIKEHIHN